MREGQITLMPRASRFDSDGEPQVMVNKIVRMEPLISENRKPQLRNLIYKLLEKQAID